MKSFKQFLYKLNEESNKIPKFNKKTSAIYFNNKRLIGKIENYNILDFASTYNEALSLIANDNYIDKSYFYFLMYNDIYNAWEVLTPDSYWMRPTEIKWKINDIKENDIVLIDLDKNKETAKRLKDTLDQEKYILLKVK